MGFSTCIQLQNIKELKRDPLETLITFEKVPHSRRKGAGKVPKNEKRDLEDWNGLCFMLDDLIAFKKLYYVLLVKVHSAQKVVHTE